jgi:CheY-like chemotaxis protein
MPEKKRVLLIDAEQKVHSLLSDYFETFYPAVELELISAFTGLQGLDQAQKAEPELIITEMELPALSGLSLLRKIKDTQLSQIPLVVFSAVSQVSQVKEALSLGASTYLVKPVQPLKLKEAVLEALGLPVDISESDRAARDELYLAGDIAIAELRGSLTADILHAARVRLSELARFLDAENKRFLLVFAEIEDDEIDENCVVELLTFFEGTEDIGPARVRILSQSERIQEIALSDVRTKNIRFVDSMVNGLRILNLQLLDENSTTVGVDFINPGMTLFATAFDEEGNLVKKKGEKFTEEDLSALREREISELRYVDMTPEEEAIFEAPNLDPTSIRLPEHRGALFRG